MVASFYESFVFISRVLFGYYCFVSQFGIFIDLEFFLSEWLLTFLGPGCSSIAYGEAEEVGPFHIKADGKTLYLNPYSWNQGGKLLITC